MTKVVNPIREFIMSDTERPATPTEDPALLKMAADIVSAFVTNNSVPAAELPAFIVQTFNNLRKVANAPATPAEPVKEPAVPVKKSVGKDYIICLEDGLKFKSLRRHLAAKYNMTPEAYRKKWDLPHDYPMVAPEYAATRSELAKKAGLGAKRNAAPKPSKKAA